MWLEGREPPVLSVVECLRVPKPGESPTVPKMSDETLRSNGEGEAGAGDIPGKADEKEDEDGPMSPTGESGARWNEVSSIPGDPTRANESCEVDNEIDPLEIERPRLLLGRPDGVGLRAANA